MDKFYPPPHVARFAELSNQLGSLAQFRRELLREDLETWVSLLGKAKSQWNSGNKVPHLTPMEFMLLSIVLEEVQEVKRL